MKVVFLISFIISTSAFISEAQSDKAFKKGGSSVSAGVGILNIWKKYLEDVTNYPDNTYKVSSNGTFTLIYEYAFTKRISAGVALGYSKISGKFDTYIYKFTESFTNYSVLARGNYHFGKFKKFDPYVGLGFGYYYFKYYNNEPGFVESKEAPDSFGYSGQLGANYYFKKHVGVYAELGYVGGSLAQLGFTVKL